MESRAGGQAEPFASSGAQRRDRGSLAFRIEPGESPPTPSLCIQRVWGGGSASAFSHSHLHTPGGRPQTLFIRRQEEPKIKARVRQVQTFAPALLSPTPTPHHSGGEGNPFIWPEPRSSSKCHLLQVIMVYHCAGQKVKVTFKPWLVSLTNLFPTLSLHGPSQEVKMGVTEDSLGQAWWGRGRCSGLSWKSPT